jgi:hypothetical protein
MESHLPSPGPTAATANNFIVTSAASSYSDLTVGTNSIAEEHHFSAAILEEYYREALSKLKRKHRRQIPSEGIFPLFQQLLPTALACCQRTFYRLTVTDDDSAVVPQLPKSFYRKIDRLRVHLLRLQDEFVRRARHHYQCQNTCTIYEKWMTTKRFYCTHHCALKLLALCAAVEKSEFECMWRDIELCEMMLQNSE